MIMSPRKCLTHFNSQTLTALPSEWVSESSFFLHKIFIVQNPYYRRIVFSLKISLFFYHPGTASNRYTGGLRFSILAHICNWTNAWTFFSLEVPEWVYACDINTAKVGSKWKFQLYHSWTINMPVTVASSGSFSCLRINLQLSILP